MERLGKEKKKRIRTIKNLIQNLAPLEMSCASIVHWKKWHLTRPVRQSHKDATVLLFRSPSKAVIKKTMAKSQPAVRGRRGFTKEFGNKERNAVSLPDSHRRYLSSCNYVILFNPIKNQHMQNREKHTVISISLSHHFGNLQNKNSTL